MKTGSYVAHLSHFSRRLTETDAQKQIAEPAHRPDFKTHPHPRQNHCVTKSARRAPNFRVLCCIVVFVCPRVARERAAARGVRGEPRALATSSRRPARGYLLGKAINPCLSLRQDNARARPLACLRVALVPRVTNKPLSPTTLIARTER